MRRTKAGRQKQAVFPLFEECASLTDDPFWKELFSKASMGKFPSGFMYKEGYLTHRRGTRTCKILLSTDPIIASGEVIAFLKEKDHIQSDNDRKIEDENLQEELIPIPEISEWNQLKKHKKLLGLILGEYVELVVEQMGLDRKQKDQLITVINASNLQGYLTNETVSVCAGKILAIEGLYFDSAVGLFAMTPPARVKTARNSRSASRRVDNNEQKGKVKNSVNFYSLWMEFLRVYTDV